MHCFGSKKEGKNASKKYLQERHHSEPNSSDYWARMNGCASPGSSKKAKKRRKSIVRSRRRTNSAGSEQQQLVMDEQNGPTPTEGGIEFSKITERIFALLFLSGPDSVYRQSIKTISERIKRTFPDRYKIFNLSQKRSDLGRANQQGAVLEFGWPDTLAPPLDRLCSICKQLENHLNASAENVAIVHCKGGVYRAGIVIAAFMNYTSICSGEENLPDRFSMKLFTEKYLGADAQPSHKRYVNYFAHLLSGSIKVFPAPIVLSQIVLHQLFPGQTVKLKLYERMKPVWSSGKLTLKEASLLELTGTRLSLRGDVLLKCYEPCCSKGTKMVNGSQQSEKNLLFQCQFNTCALGLEAMAVPKVVFHKEQLDFIGKDMPIGIDASLELCFDLSASGHNGSETRRSNTPKRGKSASPGRAASQPCGGDFSRADSYENFDRAEDDRSLSLPLAVNGQKKADELTTFSNGKQPEDFEEQPTQQQQLQHTPLTTDGADSGIGSDSPKAAAIATSSQHQQQEHNCEEQKIKKMPPPVPPKVRRHSSVESAEEPQHYQHHHHPHQPNDPVDDDDPLRGAYEDSTIGRDHSVLPPGARPSSNRRHSTHASGGEGAANSGSSSDERPPRKVIISPMVQPELVATGRYDPNSRCFSYVPVKSLKEHYQAPKKPALKRRTSVVEPADLEVSPLEAKMALHNFGLQGSSNDLRRRAETPKWEAEIDKLVPKQPLPERRARRASTSGTPVGHLQGDYVRSPSAKLRSPQDDWRHRQQRYHHPQYPPQHWNWSDSASRSSFLPNGYVSTGNSGWTTPTNAHTMPRVQHQQNYQQQPSKEQYHFYPMTNSMPAHAERPTVIEQAKRATPTPAARYSPQLRPGQRIPGVRPSPRRSDMDELCDPDFYLTYSTPTGSPVPGRKQPMEAASSANRRSVQQPLLSKSVPNDRAFRQLAQNELLRDDVRDLLAQHSNSAVLPRRSQTPQNAVPGRSLNGKYLPPQVYDEYRARNCRSVNSTPLIGSRKLFVHNEPDEPFTDPEERGAEDWLHTKMAALKSRRFIEPPIAKNRKEAEKMLLEELKSKAAKLVGNEKGHREGAIGGDPLEEYRREEQRLKNTQSPLQVLDGLRQANRTLQRERAKQHYYGFNNPVPQPIAKSFPSGTQYNPTPGQLRSLSVTPATGMTSGANPTTRSTFQSQNQQPPVPDSPTPNPRRGATPTAQIVRGKPPTPPPTRVDRERSRSPNSARQMMLRGASNSAPLQKGEKESAAVNPSLLALRQSLYAKERERMGIGGNGQQHFDWIDDEWAEPPAGEDKQMAKVAANTVVPGHGNRPNNGSGVYAYGSSSNNPTASTTFNGNGTSNRSTPVKPILKRNGATNGGTVPMSGTMGSLAMAGSGKDSPLLQRKQMLLQNHQQQVETPDEESFVQPQQHHPAARAQQNSRPQQQLGHSTAPSGWLTERSDTPQFPILPETAVQQPLPYHPLLYRQDSQQQQQDQQTPMPPTAATASSAKSGTLPFGQPAAANNNRFGALTPHSMYGGHGASGFSRRSSLTSIEAGEVIHHHPVFVKDTSRFWYKPTISREEAINMLKNKPPGTFVVRDSNSFPGAFGLALKVAQPPAGVTPTDGSELVRHFLIEPSTKGVRLKGCSNEPVFGTLAALVYQHSITPLALPCRLILPEYDPASTPEHLNSNQALLERGAACNVTFLCSVDTESLTGPEAVRRSAAFAFELLQRRELRAVPVHFKVSSQGITLTDNTRSLFFRRHYPVNSVTHAGIDPESRVFDNNNVDQLPPTYVRQAPLFGFVARKNPANGYNSSVENACHIFAELDPDQPASAVVRFITNVMMPAGRAQLQQIHQSANAH